MRRAQRTTVGVVGIAATMALHSLLFAVAIWDGGRLLTHPRLQDATGAGANTGKADSDPGERRMLVMLTPDVNDDAPLTEPAPQLPEPVIQQPSILAITGPDALPLPAFEIKAPGEDASDQDAELMARVKLAGVYESQVRARIERAWELSPELPPDLGFSCLVKIHQQRDGRVKEVELILSKCKGSPTWQQSLVNAIQVASPMPAPPHPSVFVDVFSLVFSSNKVVEARAARIAPAQRDIASVNRKPLLQPPSR